MLNTSKSEQNKKLLTANEITDVKDIKNNLLYTKSGYTIGYLRLFSINIDLLSEDEIESICNILTSQFKAEKERFTIFSIPRTVDMEFYLNSLADIHDEEIDNPYRKMILQEMIVDASKMITNGKNFEHQFYLKVWAKYNENVSGTEEIIEERLRYIGNYYGSVQNETKRLDDVEILRLCNLFANSNTAIMESYEENNTYIPIPMITRRKEKIK